MRTYVYLFVITSMLNVIYAVSSAFYDGHLSDGALFGRNFFTGFLILSTIMYAVAYMVMLILDEILRRFFEVSKFNRHLWTVLVGLLLFLGFFTIYLGHSLRNSLNGNPVFCFFGLVCLVFLGLSYYRENYKQVS